MKISKQTRELVKATNLYLKNNHIKDTSDPVFNIIIYGLIQANCYHGYNYYDESGKVNPENYTHLQILTA